MRIAALLVLLSVGVTAAWANRAVIDSLKQELHSAMAGNASRDCLSGIYQQLSAWYEETDADSSLYYLEKGLQLFKTPDYTKPVYLHLLNTKATNCFYNGELRQACDLYNQVIQHAVALKERDYELETNVLTSTGICYRRLGMRDSAFICYEKAVEASKQLNDAATTASIYFNIGVMFLSENRLQDALDNGSRSLQYASKSNDAMLLSSACSLQGAAYMRLKKYPEAIAVLKKGVSAGQAEQSPSIIMKCLPTLINAYMTWNRIDSIYPYLEMGEQCIRELPEGSPMTLGFYETEASVYNQLGKYQLSIDRITASPLQTSHTSFDQYHMLLASNYKGLNNYKAAYDHLSEAYLYRDSLFQTQMTQQMSELQARLNLNEKELEIARLETAQARQTRIRLQLIGCILLLLAVIVVLQYKRRIQKKETELLTVRKYIDGLETERRRLAKELHDGVCNDLLGVLLKIHHAPATEAGKQEAERMIERVREDVRSISHELMPPSFQFADLHEVLADYFHTLEASIPIQVKFRAENTLPWKEIPESQAYEIYRIIQEVINNILKHAHATWIAAALDWGEEGLRLEIRNDSSSAAPPAGIGDRTLSDRLKTIRGTCEKTCIDNIYTIVIVVPRT